MTSSKRASRLRRREAAKRKLKRIRKAAMAAGGPPVKAVMRFLKDAR